MNQTIYPIGIQNFEKIRKDGYLYVDKTALVYQLANTGSYYFLSRPRRFGKSLLLSTLEAYFQGKKELFEGLAIANLEKEWMEYPILHLDLNAEKYSDAGALESILRRFLNLWEDRWGKDDRETTPSDRFTGVIRRAYEKTGRRVVVLVDEYDKPLLQALENAELQEAYRAILKAFYGVLKTMDGYIRLAFLTGVTKFGKVSVFSDLNNLDDISMREPYAAICGITEAELLTYFDGDIHKLASSLELTYDETRSLLKKRYDGYHFSPTSPDMYNPFSLLCALSSGYFGAYWFSTGTPTFLVKMIRDMQIDLRDLEHIEEKLNNLMDASFDLSNAIPLMYQSGYLTIRSYDPRFRTVQLDYPNEEVEQGFLDMLMKIYTQSRSGRSEFDVRRFVLDVEAGRVDDFMTRLQALFSGYQYDQIDLGNLELHYRNVIYLAMKLMGFYTHAEMRTAAGRIDLLVKTPDYLYLFEFKINKSAQAAMNQINARDYLLPFHADGRKIVKVGVNFDDTIRSISEWIVEFE